jgi:hypothetical protein
MIWAWIKDRFTQLCARRIELNGPSREAAFTFARFARADAGPRQASVRDDTCPVFATPGRKLLMFRT